MSHLFPSRYLPCPECGDSIARSELAAHVCREERRLEHIALQVGVELAVFEEELAYYLASPRGRFELYYAARERVRRRDRRSA